MIQLLRKCLYIFQLKVIPQSVKNLVLCGYWNHIIAGLALSLAGRWPPAGPRDSLKHLITKRNALIKALNYET